MIPCVIFGELEPIFIFLDPNTNTCCKSDDAIVDWLKKNKFSVREYQMKYVKEFYDAIDHGVEYGIFAYFSEDEETIYNYSKTIDVAASFEEIFNY